MFNVAKERRQSQPEPLFTVAETDKKRRAEALLDALLRRAAAEGEFAEAVEVTPEMAELLLARNDCNRTVSETLVAAIARDVVEGRWEMNGETLIVSRDGTLNDGQHRCLAVCRTGRPIKTFIAFGVDRDTRMSVDGQQKTRNPGDYLSMSGFKDGNNVAAVAGYLWQIAQFGEIPTVTHSPQSRPTKQQINEFVARHSDDITEALHAVPKKGAQKIASMSVLAVTYLLISRATGDEEGAATYLHRLVDGANLSTTSSIYVVRERLINDKRNRKYRVRDAVELMLRGWNAHQRGRALQKTQLGSGWPKVAR